MPPTRADICAALGFRSPNAAEREVCRKYLKESPSVEKGVQGMMWSLLNTREFLLQH